LTVKQNPNSSAAESKSSLPNIESITTRECEFNNIDELPLPPCPIENTNDWDSENLDALPPPPPSLMSDVDQQRPDSPDTLPPPPPECLLAFPLSPNWQSCGQLEDKLEDELEFLEKQVNELSRWDDKTEVLSKAAPIYEQLNKVTIGANTTFSNHRRNSNHSCMKQDITTIRDNNVYNSSSPTKLSLPPFGSGSLQRNINHQFFIDRDKSEYQSCAGNESVGSQIRVSRQQEVVSEPCYASISEVGCTSPTHQQRDLMINTRSSGTLTKSLPPAPPRRNDSTKLSSHTPPCGELPQTSYFIREMDRVIAQKHDQGVNGLEHLEIPLPPPPPLILEDNLSVDFNDLPPPPPADLLYGLRTLRRTGPQVMPKRK